METGFFGLAFSSLLAIINPLGAVPMYLALTSNYSAEHRRRTLVRALITAFVVLLAFAALGTAILRFFGITTHAFKIAGGIIFFGIGWEMLHARRSRVKTTDEEQAEGSAKEDVGIIPLGLPMLAGPGAITTIVALIGQAETLPRMAMVYVALVAVLLTSWLILATAPALLRRAGQTGLNIMTRLMGLLVTVIGVQFVLDGLATAILQLR